MCQIKAENYEQYNEDNPNAEVAEVEEEIETTQEVINSCDR